MNDILEFIKDLTVVSKALEDEETPIHPQTIFAKYKTRELIVKYQKIIDEYETQQDNLYA
tara:strand:+ start:376 stop:555 length:180 start_codon:yes stop_codon:yes gene_type:complete